MRNWLAALVFLWPCAALADAAADKDFLTSWLEENLSGGGRVVTIDGFQGALSSQASLTQMTIADDSGVWITLKDVTLDWSRSALLSGRIEINELSAGEIDLERLPVTAPATTMPVAEAKPLALPDLPVSVSINSILAKKILLGTSILGQPVQASLSADMNLAGGEGAAHLSLQRSGEGPEGHLTLSASYSNATQALDLTMDAAEGAGGIAATLLHVPGAPATSLRVDGSGTLADLKATVDLSTDGKTRLAGTLTQKDDASGNRSFTADLAGDPTPVFLPQYADFFGPNVALTVKGMRAADGALKVDELTVQAQALNLHGALALNASGQPESLDLTGTLGLASGPVVLPTTSATPIRVAHGSVALVYDAATSDIWKLDTTLSGLDSGSFGAGLLTVSAQGTLRDKVFDGSARFSALSMKSADPGLAQALGPTVTGSADFGLNSVTSALQISNLALTAPGYAITTAATIGTVDKATPGMAVEVQGKVAGHYDDLSRLSLIAGRSLSGAARFDLGGTFDPLSGAFDLSGAVKGSSLTVGVAELDHLLSGDSRIQISAKRDETGITLRQLGVQAASLKADLSGTLASAGSDLSGTVAFSDLSALGAGYHGSLSAEGKFSGTPAAGTLTATANGQDIAIGQAQVDGLMRGPSVLDLQAAFAGNVLTIQTARIDNAQASIVLSGSASPAHSDLTATVSMPDLTPLGAGFSGAVAGDLAFTGTPEDGVLSVDVRAKGLALGQAQADALLGGASTLSAKLGLTAQGLRIDKADLATPQLTASVSGTVNGSDRALTVSARMANLGVLYAEFPGPVTVTGTANQGETGTVLDLAAKGPGQINATLKGKLGADYRSADLAIKGTSIAALANGILAPRSVAGALAFDLRLNGPIGLAALSGPVTISDGRLADPALNFSLNAINATARLGGGSLKISGKAGVSSGGTLAINGTVGLSAPYNADLSVGLAQVFLKDPELYATTLNGSVSFKGPATGGARIAGTIALGKTEIRIPSTGVSGEGDLPGLKHVNDTAQVKATRSRAGLNATAGKAVSGPGFGLDIRINAPNQVFVRGRGLDAEFGGSLVLAGTTTNIVPSGAFNLLRGRLDILGHRLVLSEASLQMQGALVPYVHVIASTESDGVTSNVVIDGEATNPTVSFTSTPQLPQEEVLSHLLFNKGLQNISPFQAAQLASAVATLAGNGGDGLLGNLRKSTGLDNLDVQSDGTGNSSVTAGKYFGDKTYSEVTVNQTGDTSISLNYDVARHITLQLKVESTGDSGAGVILKRDY